MLCVKFPWGPLAEHISRLAQTYLGRAPAIMSITREDGLSEMQRQRLRERRGTELSGLHGDRGMSMYYVMEWVSQMELGIAGHVKKLGLLQSGHHTDDNSSTS